MNSGCAYTAWVNSRTSLKLRNACTAPAVAHAPMVISVRDCLRTACSRSASCGVVTDPSTRDTSYGPFTTPRVASGKYAISIAPATASSSSSQSSSESWHPSQEANFHTASEGFFMLPLPLWEGGGGRGSHQPSLYLPQPQQPPHPVVAHHRTVLAHEAAGELAMPAQAHRAFHVPLQRQMDRGLRHADVVQRARGKPHHDLRPA